VWAVGRFCGPPSRAASSLPNRGKNLRKRDFGMEFGDDGPTFGSQTRHVASFGEGSSNVAGSRKKAHTRRTLAKSVKSAVAATFCLIGFDTRTTPATKAPESLEPEAHLACELSKPWTRCETVIRNKPTQPMISRGRKRPHSASWGSGRSSADICLQGPADATDIHDPRLAIGAMVSKSASRTDAPSARPQSGEIVLSGII
jgi:hypothetical protein